MEKSLVLIKPGFLEFEEQIKERISKVGKITKKKKLKFDDKLCSEHYKEHVGKPFYENLCSYMKSGDVIAFQVEGDDGLITNIRDIVGATKEPQKGTIRYDFGIGEVTRNVVHASDSPKSGEEECKRIFE